MSSKILLRTPVLNVGILILDCTSVYELGLFKTLLFSLHATDFMYFFYVVFFVMTLSLRSSWMNSRVHAHNFQFGREEHSNVGL